MAATFDTLRTVKRLRSAGASEELAEAVAEALKESRDFDLSQLATKADLAEAKFDLIKWMLGVGLAQVLVLIGAIFTFLKMFPAGHP